MELIEAHRGRGQCVVAVISAVKGETDRLLRSVEGETVEVKAECLSGGELRARDLVMAEMRLRGGAVRGVDPGSIGLRADGAVLDGEPVALDRAEVDACMEDGGVLLVPGFFGVDEGRRPLLFGRGGSDLTAVFLAGELGASECVLYKNVPGVADCDPGVSGAVARYQSQMTLERALTEGAGVVQKKALELAARRGTVFRVTNCPTQPGTLIGA